MMAPVMNLMDSTKITSVLDGGIDRTEAYLTQVSEKERKMKTMTHSEAT